MQSANNTKKQIHKGQQPLKVNVDEELSEENEKDGEQHIHSGLLDCKEQTHLLPSTGSYPEPCELLFRKEDIGKLVLTQILNQPNLNKLTHFSLDLTNLIVLQSNMLLLCSLLSKLSNLKSLNLIIQKNKLKDEHVEQLSLCFQSMKQLESLKLNMYKCEATNSGLILLTHGIFECNLKALALNLKNNEFIDFGLRNLYDMIGKFTKLQELELNLGNYLSSSSEVMDLSKSLSDLCFLITLILRFQNLDIDYFEVYALSESISEMVLLEQLELSFNSCSLKHSSAYYLFQCIQPLVGLKHLQLFFQVNVLAKRQLMALVKKFKHFKKLLTIKFKFEIFEALNQEEIDAEIEEELEEAQYPEGFEKAIEQICKKNARSLVNYQILIFNVLD